MARRKRRIEYAYELAQINLERSREELLSIPGFDARLADEQLPQLPDIDLSADMPLYPSRSNPNGVFASRSDYERTLRYLDRINRAASASYSNPSLGTPEGIATTLLTSFIMNDDTGDVIQSEFMRRESALITRRENARRLQELRDAGIEMVQVPVYNLNRDTGELEQIWTESGHKLMQWVPATPESQRRYFYLTRQSKDLTMIQPPIPQDAVIDMWGDVVPAQVTTEKRYTPEQVAKAQQRDKQQEISTWGYFANMQSVIDDVLPSVISEKFDPVFNQLLQEPFEVQQQVYELLSGKGRYAYMSDTVADIMDFDYFYRGISTSAAVKLATLYDVFRNRVVPLLSRDVNMGEETYTADDFEEMYDEDSEVLSQGQNIFERYQALKSQGKTHGISLSSFIKYKGRAN